MLPAASLRDRAGHRRERPAALVAVVDPELLVD